MTRSRHILASLPATWFLLALPAAWIAMRYLSGAITYGEAVHETGDWSVWLLMATMAVTPLRLLAPRAGWTRGLMRRRRGLGVATFGYALFHTLVYVLRKVEPALMLEEGRRLDLLTGWIALVVFLALALTSNDASVRWLRRRWKTLHRLVYPGAALVFIHWILTAFDPITAIGHAFILVALELLRLVLMARRRTI